MGLKIAEVVINTQLKSLDKIYHYLADDSLQLEKGMCVEVPFGRGNKTVFGYFTGFCDKSDFIGNLKQILRVADNIPRISSKDAELAEYIKKTCFVTTSAALRLMLPPNIKTKSEKTVRLVNHNYSDDAITPLQRSVLDTLNATKKEVSVFKLTESLGLKSSSVITTLAKKGYVAFGEKIIGAPKEKTVRTVYINDDLTDVDFIVHTLQKQAKKACSAFEILLEHSPLPLADLCELASCSYETVNVLVRRGLAVIETVSAYEYEEKDESSVQTILPELTEQQKSALAGIKSFIDTRNSTPILLHGVTGSGKTEVFLRAAQHCLSTGKNAIILVPEISLTPQMASRFISRFGNDVAILHSGLSMGERYEQWMKIKNGTVRLAVGARSAIFAPFDNIGLIVVDEEHDSSYKSESSPRYSAVNTAIFRSRQHGACLLLASATPSIDSYYNASCGKYKLINLTKRFNNNPLPDVELVDMRSELANGNHSIFSRRLIEEIEKNLKSGEQTILFLNRRGHSTFVSCRTCGYVAKCPHCSISLTYHSSDAKLHCHYCGHTAENLYMCPSCGSVYVKHFGTGTQRAEEELKSIFPEISVIRMDADTTSKKLSHEKILWKFGNENINVLLGTQMVSKGLDFPNVTLVGAINADSMLNMDDCRAAERTFAQLTQVCGRAGRANRPGRAIVQTYSPGDPVLLCAQKHDYAGFYDGEIKMRQAFANPPFTKIVCLLFSGDDEATVQQCAENINNLLYSLVKDDTRLCTEYFGVSSAPINRINGKHRYRILMKTSSAKILDVLAEIQTHHISTGSPIYMDISINPNSIL